MVDYLVPLLSLFTVVLFSCVWRVFYWLWWKPKRTEKLLLQQGIGCSPYRLFYGDLKEMQTMMAEARAKPLPLCHMIVQRAEPFLYHSTKKYGKVCLCWYGTSPKLIVMDPEMMREITSDKYGDFPKPEPNPLMKLGVSGVVTYNGEKWTKHRRILNPAFHMDKLKRMVAAIRICCDELINRWENWIGSGESFEVDVWPEMTKLTGDVISRAAFGSNYREGNRIFELQVEQAGLLMEAARSAYFPGLRFMPTKKNRRRMEIYREMNSLLLGVINKREKLMEAGEEAGDDLLGLLMQSNLRESQQNGGTKGLTKQEVIDECKLFYFAGQETTSVLLTWAMVALSMHQEWQTRARDEVLQVFGKNQPHFDGIGQLKVVTMILYEVLRLYPPLVFIHRRIDKEKILGGKRLPAGIWFILPTLLVHHDRELWGEDAEDFKPERFEEGILKATKNKLIFFPFGGGPRICIGQMFGLLEAKIALSMILQHFLFELSPSYTHAPYSVATLHPQYGAQVILRKL